MIQAIVFMPLLGAILAGLIAIFGAHSRNPSGDAMDHAHGHDHHALAHAANAHDDLDKGARRRTIARLGKDLRTVGNALGILGTAPRTYLTERRDRLVRLRSVDVTKVTTLMAERVAARQDKNFTRADEIRAELTALGVALEDTPQGTDWKVLDEA